MNLTSTIVRLGATMALLFVLSSARGQPNAPGRDPVQDASSKKRATQHYTYFGRDREQIRAARAFLETKALVGAQIAYSWRELEPEKDEYDFGAIRDDLAFLTSNGKKLFVQLQDVSFHATRINVPRYLLEDPQYHGGADKQYVTEDGQEEKAVVGGWVARRWDAAVQGRLHQLMRKLGNEFDGRIAGINLAETSVDFGETGRLYPEGFSCEAYRDAIITNMKALKAAFPKSVSLQYANFMPGEWRPTDDKGYLVAVYEAAKKMQVGVGGPDLLPHRPGQLQGPYPLIRDAAGKTPTAIAVQEGNYDAVNPQSGERVSVDELYRFAVESLRVDYVFWFVQEPTYSEDVIPFFRRVP
jgi:hypothetical protein